MANPAPATAAGQSPTLPPQSQPALNSEQRAKASSSELIRRRQRLAKVAYTGYRAIETHVRHHIGIGIMCAVAYFDPGNWSTDLLAGSEFGFKLLFVALCAGLGAVVLQTLSSKLGCVTGLDLAAHCRLLLHDHPKHPRLVRYVFLYPLYALSELAIISTDIAELLGSAIGLVLLFPTLPLPVAVALTAMDVIFILALGDPSKKQGRPAKLLEYIIIVLVLIVFTCFIILLVKVSPDWPEVFHGYLPSKTLFSPSALYAAIGIVGATVMPHALYLGSYLASQDRVTSDSSAASILPGTTLSVSRNAQLRRYIRSLFTPKRPRRDEEGMPDRWTNYPDRENKPMSFVLAHYAHGLWDVILSLLGFAVVINSAILIVAAVVFFNGDSNTSSMPASLFDAYDIIKERIGKAAAIIFAIALVASGQSASLTATLAGQIVSEGFIQWSVSPFLRRLLTRMLGLIPSMIIAIVVGRPGINTLLVISQVVLSIVLPFTMFPLIYLTSSKTVMRVRKTPELVRKELLTEEKSGGYDDQELDLVASRPASDLGTNPAEEEEVASIRSGISGVSATGDIDRYAHVQKDKEEDYTVMVNQSNAIRDQASITGESDDEFVDYSNSLTLTIISYIIWVMIIAANGYVIITLAIG